MLFTVIVTLFGPSNLRAEDTSASKGRWPPLCSINCFPFTHWHEKKFQIFQLRFGDSEDLRNANAILK